MKKIFLMALMAFIAIGASAQKSSNKPVFTTVKENKITSVKDQNRSGT